jgi:hypothetical protein
MLSAPTPGAHAFPITQSAGIAGLLTLNELQPMAGEFRRPRGFPPTSAQMESNAETGLDGLGKYGGRGRRRRAHGMQRQYQFTRAERQRLKAYRNELAAQGIPRSEVRSRVRLAQQSLMEARLSAVRRPGSHMPPGPAPRMRGLPGMRASAGQGAFLSPLPQFTETANTLVDEQQTFTGGDDMSGLGGGLGQIGQMSPQAAQQIMALRAKAAGLARGYMRPATSAPAAAGAPPASHQGGARMYVDPRPALESSFIEGKINLEPICDESGKCVRYVEPAYVQKMIGQKVGGRSAFGTGQVQLPGFYSHPSLGPWGVDPTQAYQYWAQQQAAMQSGAFASPMQVWGSPGVAAMADPILPPGAGGGSSSFSSAQTQERF